MKDKLTKLEKSWILYDVGNSAFVLMVSTVIPIYFKNIAGAAGVLPSLSTAYWGYASSLATLITAVIGPIIGTLADLRGRKKPLFFGFLMISVVACSALGIPKSWYVFLGLFVLAKVAYMGTIIFYDSMITDITSDARMDRVSSHGYAWGYIGSCIPFIGCISVVLLSDTLGISSSTATAIAFVITAAWWFCTSIPLLRRYRQVYFVEKKSGSALGDSFRRLGNTLRNIRQNKNIFLFLLAFFFYIDGVYTIIDMAAVYGMDVGIGDDYMLYALLLTQFVAFPCVLIFSRLSKRFRTRPLIEFCIIGYIAIVAFALQLDRAWEFWFLAVCVAVLQGAIQALSRSYFAKLVPKENSNEFFGFYDIFGKGAVFTGTLLMGLASHLTGSSWYGVLMIAVTLCIGLVIFHFMPKNAIDG